MWGFTSDDGSRLLKQSYLFTAWSRVLLQKLTRSQLVKKFPALYGTWRFITTFTSARKLCLSWASMIQSMPSHPTSWRSVLILSSYPSGLFPVGFPTKPLHTPLLSLIYSTRPAHLMFLGLITQTILCGEDRSLSSPLCYFLHSPVTFSLLNTSILLSTLYCSTLSLHSSPDLSDQFTYLYKTTGKIIVIKYATHKILFAEMKMHCHMP